MQKTWKDLGTIVIKSNLLDLLNSQIKSDSRPGGYHAGVHFCYGASGFKSVMDISVVKEAERVFLFRKFVFGTASPLMLMAGVIIDAARAGWFLSLVLVLCVAWLLDRRSVYTVRRRSGEFYHVFFTLYPRFPLCYPFAYKVKTDFSENEAILFEEVVYQYALFTHLCIQRH